MKKPSGIPNFNAWLTLLRAPNLLTVPGDALAGCLLAGMTGLTAVAGTAAVAVLLIYMAGLIGNDLADLREDRRYRPARPLPAGQITARTAAVVAVALTTTGIALAYATGPAAGGMAMLLTAAVIAYNFLLKSVPVAGAVNMGICRGLSLCLGATAYSGWRQPLLTDPVTLAGVGLAGFVAAVTAIARDETAPTASLVWRAWLPTAAILGCFTGLFAVVPPTVPAILWVIAATLWSARLAHRLGQHPTPDEVAVMVGQLIRGLLLLQAAFLALTASASGLWAAVIITALWPVHATLARRFAPS